MTTPIPHDAASFDALDAEIASVFGASLSQVVTPDDFKGAYATPNEAALAGAWPTLAEARGTIYFVLMLSSSQISKDAQSSLGSANTMARTTVQG